MLKKYFHKDVKQNIRTVPYLVTLDEEEMDDIRKYLRMSEVNPGKEVVMEFSLRVEDIRTIKLLLKKDENGTGYCIQPVLMEWYANLPEAEIIESLPARKEILGCYDFYAPSKQNGLKYKLTVDAREKSERKFKFISDGLL